MNNKPAPAISWVDEEHQGVRYGLQGRVLIEEKSKYQKITVIDSVRYGKGLLLDGCWMVAEHQEKQYHECLVHPALSSAEKLSKILIIGGGDGGTARECLRYSEVHHIDMIEIDKRVVELSQQHLPSIGGKAWDDPRLHLTIQDGTSWIKNTTTNSYDVVIVDGADPLGPAEGLFNSDFFSNCQRILKPGGIFATQSESPEAFRAIHIDTVLLIRKIFDYADPLYGWVPMYPSGWWSWTFASNEQPRYKHPIPERIVEVSKKCEFWSPRWQKGAFDAIPAFVERRINK